MTREFSRTIVFKWVAQGIRLSVCQVGLDARSEGRVTTHIKRFVGCWAAKVLVNLAPNLRRVARAF